MNDGTGRVSRRGIVGTHETAERSLHSRKVGDFPLDQTKFMRRDAAHFRASLSFIDGKKANYLLQRESQILRSPDEANARFAASDGYRRKPPAGFDGSSKTPRR